MAGATRARKRPARRDAKNKKEAAVSNEDGDAASQDPKSTADDAKATPAAEIAMSREDAAEALLEAGRALKAYNDSGAVPEDGDAWDVLAALELAEHALRSSEQGDPDVRRAAGGTFAHALVKALAPKAAGRKASKGRQTKRARASSKKASVDVALCIRAVSACCFALLLRAFAPSCPYGDADLEAAFVDGLCASDGRGVLCAMLASSSGEGGAPDDAEDAPSTPPTGSPAWLFARGVCVVETLGEVKAALLLLDLSKDDALVSLIHAILPASNHPLSTPYLPLTLPSPGRGGAQGKGATHAHGGLYHAAQLASAVVGLLGAVLEEGAEDLTDRIWDALLGKTLGPSPPPSLPLRAGGRGREGEEGEGGLSATARTARALLRKHASSAQPSVLRFLDRLMRRDPRFLAMDLPLSQPLPPPSLQAPTTPGGRGGGGGGGGEGGPMHTLMSLLFALFFTAPSLLVPVLPRLAEDFVFPEATRRKQALALVGHLLEHTSLSFACTHPQLFSALLDKFRDEDGGVRMMLCHVAANAAEQWHMTPREAKTKGRREKRDDDERREGACGKLVRAAMGMLEDVDERARMGAVVCAGRVAALAPTRLPPGGWERLCERTRDKRLCVREAACKAVARAFACHIARIHAPTPVGAGEGEGEGEWGGVGGGEGAENEAMLDAAPALLLRRYAADKELRHGALNATFAPSLGPPPPPIPEGGEGGEGEEEGEGGDVCVVASGDTLLPFGLDVRARCHHWVVVYGNMTTADPPSPCSSSFYLKCEEDALLNGRDTEAGSYLFFGPLRHAHGVREGVGRACEAWERGTKGEQRLGRILGDLASLFPRKERARSALNALFATKDRRVMRMLKALATPPLPPTPPTHTPDEGEGVGGGGGEGVDVEDLVKCVCKEAKGIVRALAAAMAPCMVSKE